ncbi:MULTISPECIES: BTAD domain-containing putative transcriptional regulator [unclassified Streptomyces]|uniref:BTAD domain-containing putative transcriptional regulator n=1 Tax=unclassified Streptomyces TaxID=2593676 RepID=UPI0033CADA37
MRARLLGPFELAVGDRPVQLTGRQRGLSAALLLDANRPVSVETLERRLWGETPPATSAARLRALVTEVRRALGPDARAAIETRPSGYVFRIDPHHVDIIGFETNTAAGISALAHEDWSLALRRFDSALALWRGAPLQDLPTVPEKQRLIALRDTSVEARWEAAIECGQAGTAVAGLTQLTREHPLRERPHALLMRALHREGRTAEGLEVYRRLRGRLVDELAVEPSAETAALHGALLSGLPSPSRAAAPETAAPKTATDKAVRVPRQLPLSTHHFGGRDTELAQLDAALDRVRSEHGNLVHLGRLDQQVKVHGYRIEPGEIENQLRGHPEITGVVVLAAPGARGTELIACYTGVAQSPSRLIHWLRERVPVHMVPRRFAHRERFPHNANGKIDHSALRRELELGHPSEDHGRYVKERS